MKTPSLPPILLANATYYGTLAAVRELGRAGVPVIVVGDAAATATWSRYATRRVRAPYLDEPERFVEWLLEFGHREPGTVLYPTSDDVAWLYSAFRDELSQSFRMYQPPLANLQRLLDKRELFRLCAELGIAAPRTWFPTADEGEAIIAEATAAMADGSSAVGYPLLIKPATQVLLALHRKGSIVESAGDLAVRLRSYCAENVYHPLVQARVPGAARPMLQTYYPAGTDSIYSVAGFVDEAGQVSALAARKVLQRPRKLGIGLCFEAAPLDGVLVDELSALARRAGYYGVFEAEFIPAEGAHLLIDFNPRFYSQMAFEIDRGLPLAAMAYEAAMGAPVLGGARAVTERARGTRAYAHGFVLRLMLAAQRLSGRMSAGEATAWRAWHRAHRGLLTDAVHDRGDPMPMLAEVAVRLWGYASHPAVSVRSMVLDRQ